MVGMFQRLNDGLSPEVVRLTVEVDQRRRLNPLSTFTVHNSELFKDPRVSIVAGVPRYALAHQTDRLAFHRVERIHHARSIDGVSKFNALGEDGAEAPSGRHDAAGEELSENRMRSVVPS